MADETEAYLEQRKARQMRSTEQVVGAPVDLDFDYDEYRQEGNQAVADLPGFHCQSTKDHSPHVYGKSKELWCVGGARAPHGAEAPHGYSAARGEMLRVYDIICKGTLSVTCPVCSRDPETRCLGQHPHRQRVERWLDTEGWTE